MLSTAATGLAVQNWENEFFAEYIGNFRYKSAMGMDQNAIIQVDEKPLNKRGNTFTLALVNKLNGDGKTGTDTLEGFEDDLRSRSFTYTVRKVRNAVILAEDDANASAIDLANAAKPQLKEWIMNKTRTDIITALGSINGVAYTSATEANKDAWLVDNADRVLFGALRSNNSSNDHSASLANVDSTNDKLTTAAVSLMKRLATKVANPKIRPASISGSDGEEKLFVMYANSFAFRDLKESSAMQQAMREAGVRGPQNDLFKSGDLIWDSVIIKEDEEIGVLTGVGASSIDVGPVYLCGAQALVMGWKKRSTRITQTKDYGDKEGQGIEEIRKIAKLTFGTGTDDTNDQKDCGIVTGFFSAVADA